MITTIYVNLLDEAVDVKRPIQAEHIDGNVYLVVNQPYDRDIERWQFEPGDQVLCEAIDTDAGRILVAVRSATG